MSNFITESVVIYRKLQDLYRDVVFKALEIPADELKTIFKKLLDDKCEEYGLNKTNSVYDTKYYYVKTRVKAADNFYEKLIRKELGVELTASLDLLNKKSDAFKDRKAEIVGALQKLDDIIGLRIVTELKADCDNVLELLVNSAEYFLANNIRFYDLDRQPQKMQNGLDIFRIKGIYQELYGFELQIKSKINETWGDLDHTLFYKDYSISPIRDTVQITMNNVGVLLDKIEQLLFDLRESGGIYSDNAAQIRVHQLLEKELSPHFHQAYGVAYNIKELAYYLFHFRSKLEVGDNQLEELNFDFLNLNYETELNNSYAEIRQQSLILNTLEGVYINWLISKGVDVCQDTINDITAEYIDTFIELLKNDFSPEDFDFDGYMKVLISNGAGAEIFLKPTLHTESIRIFNRLIEILGDVFENPMDSARIANMFIIHYFNGNFKNYIDQLPEESELTNALVAIKDQVKTSTTDVDQRINKIVINIMESISN